LGQADVGIALRTGTDVATESAGVTLVKGELRGIARAGRLTPATMRNIRQNLFLAVPLAALGLLNPRIAGGATSLSSLSVVGNALLLPPARL
jgi:P-type Cu+ transporter